MTATMIFVYHLTVTMIFFLSFLVQDRTFAPQSLDTDIHPLFIKRGPYGTRTTVATLNKK